MLILNIVRDIKMPLKMTELSSYIFLHQYIYDPQQS